MVTFISGYFFILDLNLLFLSFLFMVKGLLLSFLVGVGILETVSQLLFIWGSLGFFRFLLVLFMCVCVCKTPQDINLLSSQLLGICLILLLITMCI